MRNTVTIILDDGTEAFWVFDDPDDVDVISEYIRTSHKEPDSIRI